MQGRKDCGSAVSFPAVREVFGRCGGKSANPRQSRNVSRYGIGFRRCNATGIAAAKAVSAETSPELHSRRVGARTHPSVALPRYRLQSGRRLHARHHRHSSLPGSEQVAEIYMICPFGDWAPKKINIHDNIIVAFCISRCILPGKCVVSLGLWCGYPLGKGLVLGGIDFRGTYALSCFFRRAFFIVRNIEINKLRFRPFISGFSVTPRACFSRLVKVFNRAERPCHRGRT